MGLSQLSNDLFLQRKALTAKDTVDAALEKESSNKEAVTSRDISRSA